MQEKGPVRVGIVGLGGIARGQHIPGYLMSEGTEIVAFCDANDDVLQDMGQDYGISFLTTDYRDLVASAEIDAVSVCTWPNTHYEISMAAIEQGKHVFCEKPLALNFQQAQEMHNAAQAAGVETAVGFSHRLTPAAHLAYHIVSSGDLGIIYQVVAVYSAGGADFAGRPMRPRLTRAVNGGGPLFEMGPHMVDMVRWWTGKEVTSVCAQHRTFVPQRQWAETGEWATVEVEDSSNVLADMEGDTTAVFMQSFAVTGRNFDQRVEIYGSEGALLYDQARPYELQACIGTDMVRICADYGMYDPRYGLYRQETAYPVIPVPTEYLDAVPGARGGKPKRTLVPAFVEAIRGERPYILPGFYEGMRAQEVLDAAVLSADERRWVDLPLE